MSLLSYNRLMAEIVETGVLSGIPDLANVNGSSIDITLGTELLIEDIPDLTCPSCGYVFPSLPSTVYRDLTKRGPRDEPLYCPAEDEDKGWKCDSYAPVNAYIPVVDFSQKEPLRMTKHSCDGPGYVLWPGEICLAHTVELFNLPNNIAAEYMLKSSIGRIFLEHLHAGWCDPTWSNAQLTLEFVNLSAYHPMRLKAGTSCGQVKFYDHDPVPDEVSYSNRGQYNQQQGATQSRGVK